MRKSDRAKMRTQINRLLDMYGAIAKGAYQRGHSPAPLPLVLVVRCPCGKLALHVPKNEDNLSPERPWEVLRRLADEIESAGLDGPGEDFETN